MHFSHITVNPRVTSGATPGFSINRGVHCTGVCIQQARLPYIHHTSLCGLAAVEYEPKQFTNTCSSSEHATTESNQPAIISKFLYSGGSRISRRGTANLIWVPTPSVATFHISCMSKQKNQDHWWDCRCTPWIRHSCSNFDAQLRTSD